MTIDRVEHAYNGIPPQPRQPQVVWSTNLARSPIVQRRPGPPVHVHDIDLTLPPGYDPDELTWSEFHGDTDLYACAYGAVIDTDYPLFERVRFVSLGDGVSFQGRGWEVYDCVFTDIHDDAVQADAKHAGYVEGCILDGVHVAFSARSGATGSGGTTTIRDTLVRLRPQVHSYKPDKYNADLQQPQGQHGPFFKVDANAPGTHLDHVVLAATQPSSYGGTLGPPPRCTGTRVTLLGTEYWDTASVTAWTFLLAQGHLEELVVGRLDEWPAHVAAHPTSSI